MSYDQHQFHKEILSSASHHDVRAAEREELKKAAETDAEWRELLALEKEARLGVEDEPLTIYCRSVLSLKA